MWIVMAGPARTATRAAVTVRWQEPAAAAPRPLGKNAAAENLAAGSGASAAHGALRAARRQRSRAAGNGSAA
jgi:hypothetical protein